jgi:hypothetical protein
LDEEIRTSNQHRWKVYLNIEVSHLVLFVSSVALVAIIKTYETTHPKSAGHPCAVSRTLRIVSSRKTRGICKRASSCGELALWPIWRNDTR